MKIMLDIKDILMLMFLENYNEMSTIEINEYLKKIQKNYNIYVRDITTSELNYLLLVDKFFILKNNNICFTKVLEKDVDHIKAYFESVLPEKVYNKIINGKS